MALLLSLLGSLAAAAAQAGPGCLHLCEVGVEQLELNATDPTILATLYSCTSKRRYADADAANLAGVVAVVAPWLEQGQRLNATRLDQLRSQHYHLRASRRSLLWIVHWVWAWAASPTHAQAVWVWLQLECTNRGFRVRVSVA